MAAGDLGYVEKKAPGAAAIMSQTIALLGGITLLACWSATQYAAWKLGFQPALGEPLIASGKFNLYMPFDYFLWLLQFGHVQGTEAAFDGGEYIVTGLHFLFVPAIWNALRQQKKFSGKSTLHGSAKFASKEDIYDATLLRRPLSVLQKLMHAFIDVDNLPAWLPGSTWLKNAMGANPRKGAAGCYVGAWLDPDTAEYHYLTHDGPEHILAFAPTRSGKGVGLVLPTLLSWPHSALVHDIKGEAWALTAGYRKAKGQKVLKFHPSAADGSSVRFNPLAEIRIRTMREVSDSQNVAQMIVDPDGKGMADHWAKTGHELLSAAILHILYVSREGARNLRGLVSFFCDPTMTIEQVAEAMLNTEHDPEGTQRWEDPITGKPTKIHPVVAESARSFLNKSENERSGVQSTAMSFLSLYRDPVVAMNTAASEFKVDDLMELDVPVTLYIVVPPNDMARLRPLIRLVINQIVRGRTEMMEFKDGRSVAGYKHRMLLMLDEFPALGKLELMEEALAFIAGYGLKAFLITQDLTQLYKAYTKDESIISNAHIRIAYAPNKFETAELLSKYTGQSTVTNSTRSYSGNRLNPLLMHVMAAENLQARALLTPDECLRLPAAVKSPDGKNILAPGDMLILPAGANPIYGKQILYFKDPIFDGRSKIRAPHDSDRIRQCAQKAAPIPCPPSLAGVQVETPASELDNFVKVDEQSDQFLGAQQHAQVAASAPVEIPAAMPQATSAAASAPATMPLPAIASAAAGIAVAAVALPATADKAELPAVEVTHDSESEELTPEQIAQLNAEADAEAEAEAEESFASQADDGVALAMLAENEDVTAAPADEDPDAPSKPADTAETLLDFEV